MDDKAIKVSKQCWTPYFKDDIIAADQLPNKIWKHILYVTHVLLHAYILCTWINKFYIEMKYDQKNMYDCFIFSYKLY
jgi:hypothetical protein